MTNSHNHAYMWTLIVFTIFNTPLNTYIIVSVLTVAEVGSYGIFDILTKRGEELSLMYVNYLRCLSKENAIETVNLNQA